LSLTIKSDATSIILKQMTDDVNLEIILLSYVPSFKSNYNAPLETNVTMHIQNVKIFTILKSIELSFVLNSLTKGYANIKIFAHSHIQSRSLKLIF